MTCPPCCVDSDHLLLSTHYIRPRYCCGLRTAPYLPVSRLPLHRASGPARPRASITPLLPHLRPLAAAHHACRQLPRTPSLGACNVIGRRPAYCPVPVLPLPAHKVGLVPDPQRTPLVRVARPRRTNSRCSTRGASAAICPRNTRLREGFRRNISRKRYRQAGGGAGD